jgi:glycosyltransferase involved in cell wall biosynthesis
VKIAFYSPLKPITSAKPSGDLMIAKDLVHFFESKGHQVEVLSEFTTYRFFAKPRKYLELLKELTEIWKRVEDSPPDLFFTYHLYYKAPDPIGPLLSYFFNRPYVVFEGSYARRPRYSIKAFLGYYISRAGLKHADHIFADMSVDYEGLTRIRGSEDLSYVAPAVDTQIFCPDEVRRRAFRQKHQIADDQILISSVAMLRPGRKSEGIEFLLKSLKKIKNRNFVHFHAGGGEDLRRLKQKSKDLLKGRSQFLGMQTREELIDLYNASDIFAFPGIDEGFGLVYLEAQACGLPVVAFNNGGIPDAVLKDVTAFLTPLGDSKTYTNALIELIDNEKLRKTMSVAARDYCTRNHDREKNYSFVLSKCEEIISSWTKLGLQTIS